MKRNKVSVEHGEHVTTIIVEPQWPEGVRDKVPTPEQPTTCLIMFAIVALGFCATVLHAVPMTAQIAIAAALAVLAFLALVRRVFRQDEERFNAALCPASKDADAPTDPKMSDDELTTKLLCALSAETLYKSDCFDYLCWLNETEQRENVKDADFLVMASDGTTCWGHSYSDAVKVAMRHDKELYDAVQNLVMPEGEHQNQNPLPSAQEASKVPKEDVR